jgi:pyruvate-formate lyase-activating enzyme
MMSMPGWTALGIDPDSGKVTEVPEIRVGRRWLRVWAVSAIPPPGYMRLALPAALRTGCASVLPLWAYTAVGAAAGGTVMAASRVDMRRRWDTKYYETPMLAPSIRRWKDELPDNRIVAQLSRCAGEYFCSTARNLFLGRFEAALPLSQSCNSRCIGCISKKHEEHPCSQERIGFKPLASEGVEIAARHMAAACDPIVSFGQGCEGEPLTEYKLIAKIIHGTRESTDRGVFNMNTNGSLTHAFGECVDAGLGSVRVSLNSAVDTNYSAYFRPRGYTFDDVRRTIKLAAKRNVFLSLNLQIFPGVTDTPSETEAIIDLCRGCGVRFIQLRNLCIDQSIYPPKGFTTCGVPMGMGAWLAFMKHSLPGVGFGCYNSTPSEIGRQDSIRR